MTTNILVGSASDLSVSNEVLNISCKHLPEGHILAGAKWTVDCPQSYDALLSVLKFVYSLIIKKLPGYDIWLLVGTSAWQPDTRVVRYRKLWGLMKARGVEISHAGASFELMQESKGKLKFFGAVKLSELSVKSAVKAFIEERCTYIIALPTHVKPQDILDTGWAGDFVEDSNVIVYASKHCGLLLKRYGLFDDDEKGIVAIGQPELIRTLVS